MPRSAAILADGVRIYLKSLGHLGGKHRELREGEMFRGNGYAFAIGQLGAISFDEFLKLHHCLSVDSRCLRKEGGRISRTAWPNWATWPCSDRPSRSTDRRIGAKLHAGELKTQIPANRSLVAFQLLCRTREAHLSLA